MVGALWVPTPERINASNLQAFERALERNRGVCFGNYDELHRWSIEYPEEFWSEVWRFAEIRCSRRWEHVLEEPRRFPGARWFGGARLNFAENLLRFRDQRTALVARLENGERSETSYAELYESVSRVAAALRQAGVVSGDRVAGFLPNIAETVVAMLATASIGAIWSSCSPDFGFNGVIDRFGQIEPKVLFACDGYYYNGKTVDAMGRVREIRQAIRSIEQLVLVPVVHRANPSAIDLSGLEGALLIGDMLRDAPRAEMVFEQLSFDHPLYVMYSSGTTGVPKCIVHGAGGSLIQHQKEHLLHVDLRRDDVFFYFTTCGWMMWNWLVSGLAVGATLVLYDGSPFYPAPSSLIDMAEQEQISVFGVGAKYIASLEKAGVRPRETHRLDRLRTVLSTGSPLSPESFEYVYRDIKSDVCLSSIAGGTDLLSCFVLGNPTLPVYAGELQCRGLGMAVQIWNEEGAPVTGEKGELVCTRPFPSCPIYFWNDPGGRKFHSAYFDKYPGVWAHGDYGEITSHGGMLIHGRSDAVLNPGGVRIGTAEIYRQVEKVEEVLESICIGQDWQDDVRVVLFVVLRPGLALDEALEKKIRAVIRAETTPRHVPARIVQVADIPRTISGKIVELAVRNVVHGKPVKNTDALANPEALEYFRDLPALKS
jgi:acetoacetyl-CoA synthetase